MQSQILERGTGQTGDFIFKPIQPWEKSASRPTMQRVTHREDFMDAPAYGVEVDVDRALNVSTEDLYHDMLERESEFVSPSSYNPTASYIPYRRYLVDWMSDVGEQYRLHNTTIHVSVLYMDKIFRSEHIPRSLWQLFATACITVAAKYEEAEEHCPNIPELLRFTKLADAGYDSLAFRDGEVEVLKRLGWQLRAFPAFHMVGYILAKGACFVDDAWQGRHLIPKIPRYIKKYAEFFCNLALQDYSFQQYRSSKLAAAAVMAARVSLQIEPKWRPELVRLTGYEEYDILPIFNHLWAYYEEQFPGHGSRSISPRSVIAN